MGFGDATAARVAALLAAGALFAAEPAAGRGARAELVQWSRGPVKWLLLAPEQRELRKVETKSEALAFIERFWLRRDPEPSVPGNAYRDAFHRRVSAADQLYREGRVRGSMTDRGRTLILLGSPSGLKVSSRPGLRWNPGRDGRKATHRNVAMETWIYRLRDLPQVLREALAGMGHSEEIGLSFVTEYERTRLVEGESILDLAARVALAKP